MCCQVANKLREYCTFANDLLGKGLTFQVKIEDEQPRRSFGIYSWFRVMLCVFFHMQHCDGRHRNNVNSDLAFYYQLESLSSAVVWVDFYVSLVRIGIHAQGFDSIMKFFQLLWSLF